MVTPMPSPHALDAVADVVAEFGVGKRRLRAAVAALTERRHTTESVVLACALPRRTVESMLRAADPDLDKDASGCMIRADLAGAHSERFALAVLRRERLVDPYAALLAAHGALIAQADANIAAAPTA